MSRTTAGTIPLALALTSVSSNGGSHGIVLSSTSGSFAIAGDAGSANNSSGGTIQSHTTYGISLLNAQNVSLDQVTVQNISQNGIDGTGVINFTFTNGTVFNTGTSAAGQYEENSMAFVDNGAPFDSNTISGNVTLTGSTISQPRRNAVMIETWNGTIGNLTISNNTFTGGTTTANIADAIHVFSQGSATTTGSITTGKVQNNTISGFKFLSGAIFIGGSGMFIAGGNTSASTLFTLGTAANPIEISGNDVDDVGSNGIAVSFNGQQGISNFNIHDNGTMADPMSNMEGLGISVFFGGNGTFSALVNNNAIDNNGPTVNAGSSGIGVQMDSGISLTDAPNVTMTVNNNRVTNPDGTGIRGIARNCAGTMNLKVQNNVVTAPSAANRNGIRIDSGSGAGDTTLCLNMTGNTSAGSGVNQPFGIRKQGIVATVNDFGINGLVPSPATAAQAAAKVSADNGAAGVDVLSGDNFVSCKLLKSSSESGDKVTDDIPPADLRETLMAHHGEAPQRDYVQPLSHEELNWMAGAAMEEWRNGAIPAESLAQLEAATFEVRDLPEGQLATREGNRILVDATAAGAGWYIDQAPTDSVEFDVRVRGREFQTTESSPAFGRYDLLTALTRELGSIYLEGLDRTPKRLRPLMEGLLLPGTRRLPLDKRGELQTHDEPANKAGVDEVAVVDPPTAAQPVELGVPVVGDGGVSTKVDDDRSGETLTRNIGTVPAGKTVTITFRVTIDTPFPVGVCMVSNQGTISGSNFANVLTDDPAVGGAADPTMTTIPIPPVIGACPANITVNNTPGVCGAVVTATDRTDLTDEHGSEHQHSDPCSSVRSVRSVALLHSFGVLRVYAQAQAMGRNWIGRPFKPRLPGTP